MSIAKYLKLPSFREWVFPTAEEGNSEKGGKKSAFHNYWLFNWWPVWVLTAPTFWLWRENLAI